MNLTKGIILSAFAFVILAGGACSQRSDVETNVNTGVDGDSQTQTETETETEVDGGETDTNTNGSANININADVNVNADAETEIDEGDDEPTRVIEISANRFEFTPSTIRAKVGERVIIRATSEDVTHGIFIPDFDLNMVVPPGEVVTGEFVADQAGTFSFRCSVYCGAGHSTMTGTLIVE